MRLKHSFFGQAMVTALGSLFFLTILAILLCPSALIAADADGPAPPAAKEEDPLLRCQSSVERLEGACKAFLSSGSEKVFLTDKEITNLPFDVTNGILKAAGKEPQVIHNRGKKILGETFVCPDGGHYLISIVNAEASVKCDKHGNLAEIKKAREANEKKSLYIKIGLGVAGVLMLLMILR